MRPTVRRLRIQTMKVDAVSIGIMTMEGGTILATLIVAQ